MSTAERSYTILVYTVAVGVLLQAVLAGQFLSGYGLRAAHELLANALFALVVVQAALAGLLVRRGRLGPVHAWAGLGLILGLTAQIGLGYVGEAVTRAIHIPLGVALFGATTWLAVLVRGRGQLLGEPGG